MKKGLIIAGIVLSLIICVLIILPFVININGIIAGQIPAIEKQIHRKVVIGDVKLTLLTGLGAEITGVQISNNPDFAKDNFISIEKLKATVQLLPLLKKKVLISSISIDRPFVLIERNAQGEMNFSDMIPPKTPGQASPTPKKAPAESGQPPPLAALENIQIHKISITKGNFKFSDAFKTQAPEAFALDQVDLTLKAVSLSQKINIDGEADMLAGPKAGHIKLSGDVGPVGDTPALESIPVDLTVSVNDINLPHLAGYVKGIQIKSGALDLTTVLKGRLQEKLQFSMDMDWDKLDMTAGADSKDGSEPAPITMDGKFQINVDLSGLPNASAAGSILENLEFKAGIDAAAGKVGFGNVFQKESGTPLSVNCSGRLAKDDLRINDLKFVISQLVMTGSGGIRDFSDPFIDGTAKIPATPLNAVAPILPFLKGYDLNGTLTLTDARFKGKIHELKNLTGVSAGLTITNGSAVSTELGKKIEKIQATVTVADHAIRISDTSLQVGPSDLRINAIIRNPAKPDITFDLASTYLEVDSFLPPTTQKKESSKPETPKQAPASSSPSSPKTRTPEKQSPPDIKAGGHISIKKCKYDKFIFDNVLAEIQVADAAVILKSLSFNTFEGKIAASGNVNITDMQSPLWSADLSAGNINSNAALSALTSVKDTFYGNFNTKVSIKGKGKDWPAISKTLTGNGTMDVTNGKLANINVIDAVGESLIHIQGLSSLAQGLSPERQKKLKETQFDDLSGKFNLHDEKIQVDSMVMSSQDFTLTGTGDIGFDKKLDLQTSLVLSKSESARLQKDKVMKYLVNKEERIEIPCAIKGDVSSPRVTVNTDSVNRLLKNAATDAVKEKIQKGIEKNLGKDADTLLKQLFK